MAATKTKADANYRTRAQSRHCQDCSMYRRPNDCTLVKGYISPMGTCRFWEAKKDGAQEGRK
jgi:hypothetical protein